MSVDVTALKRRRAAFAASGQTDKVRRMDAEIAVLRGAVPAAEDAPRPEGAPVPAVETAEADLDNVEAAAAVRRGPGRPRKQR